MTSPTTVQVRLQIRADTAANWTASNPVLLANELGRETDTGKFKIGNGSTAWSSLSYQPWSQLTYPIVNADIDAAAEIAVSKLADGTARQLLQTDAAGTGVEWASNIDVPGTLDVTGASTFDAGVTIQGDLTVNGTTTTIDTQNLIVEDKNIEIGKVATPTDVTADGGGITLKGSTDKTINWVDATDAWTFSEHVNIASAKEYRIAGTKVLDATSLGSGVISSSLTSVGTIGAGTWQGTTLATGYGGTGQTTYTNGQLLIGKNDGTLAKATLTASTGVTITNGDGTITISATGSGGTVTSVTATSPLASTGGTTPDISIQDGTTTQKGAVQLEDSTSSTSTTKAATPASVKAAYDLANAALPKAGGTMTGDIVFSGTQTFPGTGSGTVTSIDVSGGTGLTSSGGPITSSGTITIDLDNTAVTPASYTYASITVDQQGRLTAASSGTTPLTSSDIGVTVQGFDADTAKLDTTQTFTAAQTFASDLTLNAQNDLRFADSDSSNWVAFQAPATIASNVTWTLPDADGTSTQVLSTNGSGTLSWASVSSDKISEGNTEAEVVDTGSDGHFKVTTEGTERARIDSSGRLLVGTSTTLPVYYNAASAWNGNFQVARSDQNAVANFSIWDSTASTYTNYGGVQLHLSACRSGTVGTHTSGALTSGDTIGSITFDASDGTDFRNSARIEAIVDGGVSTGDVPGRLVFSTTADGASSPTERMRITQAGAVLVGKTTSGSPATVGAEMGDSGYGIFATSAAAALFVNRNTSDGTIVSIRQDNTEEGTISVSGTTVSYNGAHLSRWSQLPGGTERTEILRGTVLSNIDEMCAWGEEDNEQLNRMQISDVEGDPNVAGVFQAWDDDDDTYPDDFYCAMTGDFIIRIAEGVTVQRGDLLMSAGDGTAKPQGDGFVQDKTIAKVTSNHVTCTYDDGSYCVPCVLMAC